MFNVNPLGTVNEHTFISEIFHICGAYNILPGKKDYFITTKKVLSKNPAAIIDVNPENTSGSTISDTIPLYRVTPDYVLRYSPQVLNGINEVCHLIQKLRYSATKHHNDLR